jgi:hypothetical protein
MAISTTAVQTPRAKKTAFIIVGIVVALIGAAFVIADQRAAPIRAAAAQLLAAEMAAGIKAFCEKNGMPAETPAHATCISDVYTIRDSQTEKRVSRDSLFGFLSQGSNMSTLAAFIFGVVSAYAVSGLVVAAILMSRLLGQ